MDSLIIFGFLILIAVVGFIYFTYQDKKAEKQQKGNE